MHPGLGGLLAIVLACITCLRVAVAAPPPLEIDREQRILVPTDESKVLRIWIIYVGQGDSILIQLPQQLAPPGARADERIEILVDGGPSAAALVNFLDDLYAEPTQLEYAVITHHDADHVVGLTGLVKRSEYTVGRVFHNGLASWSEQAHDFAEVKSSPRGKRAIYKAGSGKRAWQGMARLVDDGEEFQERYVIRDFSQLETHARAGHFVSVYGDLAAALRQARVPISGFDRAFAGSPFIDVPGASELDIELQPLWPAAVPRAFKDWGHTINGNSVTFKLRYRDFTMLFTGDHNIPSESYFLERLGEQRRADLRSDVLKVPHHGSEENVKSFIEAVAPVISVASMGRRGFHPTWRHPALSVIEWAGGYDRIYHTYIHERPFTEEDLRNERKRNQMVEATHILIETDGHWFRVVETDNPSRIPDVDDVEEGNGTQWIRARE